MLVTLLLCTRDSARLIGGIIILGYLVSRGQFLGHHFLGNSVPPGTQYPQKMSQGRQRIVGNCVWGERRRNTFLGGSIPLTLVSFPSQI